MRTRFPSIPQAHDLSRRSRGTRLAAFGAGLLCPLAFVGAPAEAQQTVPTSDTEDAELGSRSVGGGRLHPFISLDVRNGDYARGSYDDDASDLRQIPFHAQLGLVIDLHQNSAGDGDAFLLIESNNGFHGPSARETSSPRSWYESNNLIGLAVKPADGLTAALSYTNKRSPNGASGITHEASFALAYEARSVLGRLHPTFAVTGRPAAGRGAYAQFGVEPEWTLGRAVTSAKLSIPAHAGVGWGGFYQVGTGTIAFGNVGLALTQPFSIAGTRMSLRAEVLALIRDSKLRALDDDDADRAAVVPFVMVGVSTAF